eukprot:TRINITY_DN13761_c0_g1_i1.p1 TRINITY_DN13761_c0_g1~~TRINITY_DN13761_c0_g1_i1.p1  ORF type:complete len:194 (+),score=36.57 TRINITY_DN13761_c0_g1_i1:26-607(+)
MEGFVRCVTRSWEGDEDTPLCAVILLLTAAGGALLGLLGIALAARRLVHRPSLLGASWVVGAACLLLSACEFTQTRCWSRVDVGAGDVLYPQHWQWDPTTPSPNPNPSQRPLSVLAYVPKVLHGDAGMLQEAKAAGIPVVFTGAAREEALSGRWSPRALDAHIRDPDAEVHLQMGYPEQQDCLLYTSPSPRDS